MKSSIPIFVLHGWSQQSSTREKWQPFLSILEEKGWDCRYLSLPGLDAPLARSWKLSDYLHWLENKVGSVSEYVLLGHSFGGQLAAAFASRQPSGLKKLVLISPSGIKDNSLKMRLKRLVFGAAAKIGKKILDKSAFANQFRQLLYKAAREQDYLRADPLLRQTMTAVINTDISNRLSRVKAPCLLVWGKQDTAAPFKHSQIFQQWLPNSELVAVDQARHCPHYYYPELVARYVSRFFLDK